MTSINKIVTEIPLTNLWRDKEHIYAKRERHLTANDVQNILKKYPVEFVIADIGKELKWVNYDKSFKFWKTELKLHLTDNFDHINLDKSLGNYAYVASEWTGEIETPIILLEKHH